jgi:hypothetical protein
LFPTILDFSESRPSPCVIVSAESVFPVRAVVHESLCTNLSSPRIFHSVYSPQWIGLALVLARASYVCVVSWFYLPVTPWFSFLVASFARVLVDSFWL